MEKSTYHEIIKEMNRRVKEFFYEETRAELEGEGYDTDEFTKDKVIRFFEKSGFVSMEFENGKAFLYALNPYTFIDNKLLWDFVQSKIQEKFGVTLCIGKFKLEETEKFNPVFIYDYTTPEVIEEYSNL